MDYLNPVLINDPRLTSDMKRTRSGSTQLFRKDYGDCECTRRKNADVVLEPPERHVYAELIDGKWYWINGCDECYGREYQFGKTYIKCKKHDVCVTCGTPRSELKETPWGVPKGIQCKPCADKEHEIEKANALDNFDEDNFDPCDYEGLDTVKCPYCECEEQDPWNILQNNPNEEVTETITCSRCDNEYNVKPYVMVYYDCKRINED